MVLNENGSRWKVVLPLAAAVAAGLMIALAALTHHSITERNELALEGRLLGLAHSAETLLRDAGTTDAEGVLSELLADGGPEVAGLTLLDSSGTIVTSIGAVEPPGSVRSVDLFLGRHGGSDVRPRRQGTGQPGQRGGGYGRYELQMHLDPTADSLPVTARLLLPTVILAGIALVWLAFLAGRHLDRQRHEIRKASEHRRMEGLARAGAGLAHQLRTPLATIKGTSQLMVEDCSDETLSARIETVITQADRMNRLLGRLLDYARPPSPEPQLVRIAEIAAEVADQYPTIDAEGLADASVFADREHVVEILDNLLANAVFFSPEGARVSITTRVVDDRLHLRIGDRGPGPGDDPEMHFEPYQTSRADGTGLGLPIARALAEANGGSLDLESRIEGGCNAVLDLPLPENHP